MHGTALHIGHAEIYLFIHFLYSDIIVDVATPMFSSLRWNVPYDSLYGVLGGLA
jgi:hypothetical protein